MLCVVFGRNIVISSFMVFSHIINALIPSPSFSFLYVASSFSLIKIPTTVFPLSSLKSHILCYFFLPPCFPTTVWGPFYFPGFLTCIGYRLTSENMDLGTIDNQEHMTFLFLHLRCYIQYLSNFMHLLANVISFLFLYS